MDEYYDISRLIAGAITNTITEEQRLELEQWRASLPEREELYRELCDCERRQKSFEIYSSFDNKVQFGEIIGQSQRLTRRRLLTRISRYAVAACVVLIAGVWAYTSLNQSGGDTTIELLEHNDVQLLLSDGTVIDLETGDRTIDLGGNSFITANGHDMIEYPQQAAGTDSIIYNEIIIKRGSNYKVKLSDGTQVWMNSDSRLRYPVAFSDGRRVVELKGEAYFEVAHDERRPFVVNTSSYEVTVLGTRFNLSNYIGDPVHRAVLLEGSVRVRDNGSGDVFVLKPNEAFYHNVAKGSCGVEQIDADLFVAWRDGKLRYYEERLDIIMNAIERLYDVEVKYDDPSLGQIEISLFADHYQSIDPLLRIFNEHGKINITREGRILTIKKGIAKK